MCKKYAISFLLTAQFFTIHADEQKKYIEESDKNFSITCERLINYDRLTLNLNGEDTGVTCLFNNTACLTIPGLTYQLNNNIYIFTLNISNISSARQFKTITCKYGTVNVLQYNIIVLAKAQNTSCDSPSLTTGNKYIALKCQTNQVFPPAKCTFYFQNKLLSSPEEITYSHVEQQINSFPYYQSNCSVMFPVTNFEAGTYTFQISVLPDVTSDMIYSVNKTTQSIVLSLPTSNLANDCFKSTINGYTKPGTTVTCTCYLTGLGSPPGSVRWYNENNDVVEQTYNSTVTVIGITSDRNQYKCKPVSDLNGTKPELPFLIKYAKGPKSCEVKEDLITPPSSLALCGNKDITLPYICQVNEADAIPGIKSMFSLNLTEQINIIVVEINNYTTKVNITISRAGDSVVGCKAQNSIFNDMMSSCANTITVFEPPTSKPALMIVDNNNNNVSEIIEIYSYKVYCSVNNGIPLVSNITISCGNISEMMQTGNTFTSFVTFTRNMTGQMCACTAQHVTNCYSNNKTLRQLDIYYASSVESFGIVDNTLKNNTNKTYVMEKGGLLQFNCFTLGNPTSEVNILKNGKHIIGNTSSLTSYHVQNISCTDAGTYYCQASNKISSHLSKSENIKVYVKCLLEAANEFSASNTFTHKVGQTFSETIVFVGYNEILNFSLVTQQNGQEILESRHKLTYSTEDPPYVNVDIELYSLTKSDFSNYSLIITQGGTLKTFFNFSILEGKEPYNASDDNSDIAVIVGCVIGGLVIITLVIAAFFIARKYKISFKCVKRKKAIKRQTSNYNDLEVTQQKRDYMYETPQFSSTNTSSVKTNYANIDIPLRDEVESPYEKVD